MIDAYLEARLAETDRIDPDRRRELDALAGALRRRLHEHGSLDLLFVCTHNSRRSHFGQVWAGIAARRFGLGRVATWSGGTETTAFEPRAIAALERAGLVVERGVGPNPVHRVRERAGDPPILCWSKPVADPANPQRGFVAVMTCASAEAACPTVPGAALRVALTYDDPKASDGTAGETSAYDERCAQIAREMLHLFARVAAIR